MSKEEKEKWEKETLEEVLKKNPERKEKFETLSGIEVERVSAPEDFDYLEKLGFPGEFPFTRGVYPTMYRGKLWTMRQFAGFGTAEQTNERYKYLLKNGQTGLSVAFDMPTIYGYDSDHPMALGEVGKCGVAISSLEDMETLFKDIPIDKISTSMTINGPAAVLWGFYIAMAENRGIKKEELNGTIQNDILKEYIAQKSWIFPPKPSIRLIIDTFEYGTKNIPKWNTISISGYHIREAGSTAVQELAFTLADGLAYADAAIKRGLCIDDFAPRLSFFFNSHNNFFEEIAKFRAARRIWAKEMKQRGAKKAESMKLRFHTQTAGCSLAAKQPENNVIRVTLQALAAVLGGTQSLHTNSKDEALALPAEEAVKTALRTQQIIAYESGVTDSIDPLGGSYFVESLTDKMEKLAYGYFDKIKSLGGVESAIEDGFFQREIAQAAFKQQKDYEAKKIVMVGVNEFEEKEEVKMNILKVDPSVEKTQKEKLSKLRERRDNDKAKETLELLKKAAADEKANVMPFVIDCAKAYCTLGEIRSALVEVFGEYTEAPSF